MAAACCGDRCGFKNLLADGAFLMLSAFCGFGSCRVNDPLAGAVSRNIGLVAALALVPVIGVVILPICAVAVGMARRRILIGGLNLHIITGHGEGGGGAGLVSQCYAACLNDPLIKDLAGRSRICSQGNGCTFCRFADFASCANCRFTVCNGDVVLYCFVCYNNGFVFVHRNIQSIARYRCCSTVHRNGVDFIANFRVKGNRFG